MIRIEILLILSLFTSCITKKSDLVDQNISSSYYRQPITGNIIYCPNGNMMQAYEKVEASADSFKVLAQSIAKDKTNIYSRQYMVEHNEADVNSFVVDDYVLKDKLNVYYIAYNSGERSLKRIIHADVGTFSLFRSKQC